MSPIINRDDLPITPEWIPERRDVSHAPKTAADEVCGCGVRDNGDVAFCGEHWTAYVETMGDQA